MARYESLEEALEEPEQVFQLNLRGYRKELSRLPAEKGQLVL